MTVAEHLRRPLLRFIPLEDNITLTVVGKGGGSLHTGFSGLENAIQMAADWGAVMLYDGERSGPSSLRLSID